MLTARHDGFPRFKGSAAWSLLYVIVWRRRAGVVAVPERWAAYECGDYFAGGWAERGHFDEPSQTLVIVPLAEAYEDAASGFFAVGRSGCGGIDFGYRRGYTGLWAYHPISREWQYMAATVAELAEGWCSGRLNV